MKIRTKITGVPLAPEEEEEEEEDDALPERRIAKRCKLAPQNDTVGVRGIPRQLQESTES
jgi:hypothetical protein